MKEVRPYKTVAGMAKALDNGGRFYNVLTKAGDDVVTGAELARAAGTWSSGQAAFLYMEMARFELEAEDKKALTAMLDGSLLAEYKKHRPVVLAPSAVEARARSGRSAIVQGYPRFVEDRTKFTGFIMIPMVANKVTTFTMIPIFDRFDVYEVFDDRRMRRPNSVIAITRGVEFPALQPVRFGGIVKKLEQGKSGKHGYRCFVEALYYTRLT